MVSLYATAGMSQCWFDVCWGHGTEKVAEKQHTPILKGLGTLAAEREWEVEVVPLVVGHRSVKETEWLEPLGIFGIGKEDGKRIIGRLGHTQATQREREALRQLLSPHIRTL